MRGKLLRIVLTTLVGAIALSGLLAGPAFAADQYASPDSTRTTGPCELADPCRLDTVLGVAAGGDDILLEPGEYFSAGTTPWGNLPGLKAGATMHGIDPADPPVLHGEGTVNASPFLSMAAGSILRDVEIRATAAPTLTYFYGVESFGGSILDRVVVRVAGNGTTNMTACVAVGSTLRNSACLARGAGNLTGVQNSFNGANYVTNLINVTGISTGTSGNGASVGISTAHSSVMNISNSILRGPTADLRTGTRISLPPTGSATINIEYSNWNTYEESGLGTNMLVLDAGNQNGGTAATPIFRDAAQGNYRAAAGSPTIDAGVLASDPLAPGGATRTIGTAPDMGAFEFAPPPAVTTGPATQIDETTAVLNATINPGGSPSETGFTLGPQGSSAQPVGPGRLSGQSGPTDVSFSVTGLAPGTTYVYRGTAVSPDGGYTTGSPVTFTTTGAKAGPSLVALKIAKRWRLRKGTAIRIRSRGADRVRLRFDRKRGKRFRKAGAITVKVKDGLNRRKFKGRVGKKRLKPGTYRLVGVAVSADGKRSKPKVVRFRVRR